MKSEPGPFRNKVVSEARLKTIGCLAKGRVDNGERGAMMSVSKSQIVALIIPLLLITLELENVIIRENIPTHFVSNSNRISLRD